MFKKIKESLENKQPSREAEYKLYEKVSREITKGERDEGVWTLAFAKSEGNNQKAEALYIELMVQRYKDQIEEDIRQEKLDRETREVKAAEEETKKRNKDRKILYRKGLEKMAINVEHNSSEQGRFIQDVIIASLIFGFLVLLIFTFYDFPNSSSDNSEDSDILAGLTNTEYNSVHEDTYWFVNEEATLEGFYIGTVRSNLVWADRMSVFLHESNCGLLEEPEILMLLTTNKLKKDYPNIDLASLSNKSLELDMDFDGKYFEKNIAVIEQVFELDNGNHAFQLNLTGVYSTLAGMDEKFNNLIGWQFLTLKITEDDPSRKYFDLPERQYRMLGFVPVMVNLVEQCKMDASAK